MKPEIVDPETFRDAYVELAMSRGVSRLTANREFTGCMERCADAYCMNNYRYELYDNQKVYIDGDRRFKIGKERGRYSSR